MNLNIGGGPQFRHPGWTNLDAAAEPAFAFSPACVFPLADASVELAYSSHCLEHLDEATVARVLAETHRVLKPKAPFVVKLPDWQGVLDAWRRNDHAYFAGQWGFEAVCHTWDHDSITARASMVFCGFWNKAWGDHFKGERPGPGAYHGPAMVPDDFAAGLMAWAPIPVIARTVAEIVRKTEPGATFNHQTAWGFEEFGTMVAGKGFEWESFGGALICDAYRPTIPGIDDMAAISTYYEFVRG